MTTRLAVAGALLAWATATPTRHAAGLAEADAPSAATPADTPPPRRWGDHGHRMAARAAVETLPDAMPAFFRAAGEALVYLNPEPDRWRRRGLVEMDQAWSYDHYIDVERVPPGTMDLPDRFAFLRALYAAGISRPERDVGFLPFRIVELYQRLVTEWRLWRATPDAERRGFIEHRIVNDAGILGHYVTDAANPHHTTIHFNGWDADTPNPQGFTQDREFHARFESWFVGAHVGYARVRARMVGSPASVAGGARAAVQAHVQQAHDRVERLYRLDRDVGFDPSAPAHAGALDFAVERLASGADMLRTLWWSAWLESAGEP